MKLLKYAMFSTIALACFACSSDDESGLKNDMIKKTTAPAIVGEKIEFAYAMGTTEGRLAKAEATASFAGATGTDFELYSWFTARGDISVNGVNYRGGDEVPLQTVKDASTSGVTSVANMMETVDTHYFNPSVAVGTSQSELIAATLRYNYVVPAEAKGKSFHITFTATSTTGSKVTYETPSYPVSKMDMKRLIELENGAACCFSLEDMAAYTTAEAASMGNKIDFIYNYQKKTDDGFDYGHSFVSPATDPKFIALSDIIPSGASNDTPMEQRAQVHDAQLKGANPAVYVDDVDFETLDLSRASNYVLNLKNDDGVFMKSADGKYAAFVYVNRIDDSGKVTISLKRYPLK